MLIIKRIILYHYVIEITEDYTLGSTILIFNTHSDYYIFHFVYIVHAKSMILFGTLMVLLKVFPHICESQIMGIQLSAVSRILSRTCTIYTYDNI